MKPAAHSRCLLSHLALLAAVLAMSVAAPRALARDSLEGKWEVTVTPDTDAQSAGAKEMNDVYTFKGGTFDSKEMAKHGFEKGEYDEDSRGIDVGGFKAEKTSKKDEGKAKWSGTVTADQMSGDFVWTKKDGTVLNYTIKGTKK